MVSEACPTNPREEASGLDPEAVHLALQPPPLRWIGLICLAVVTPVAIGWLLGNVVGIGP